MGEKRVAIFRMIMKKRTPSRMIRILLLPTRREVFTGTYFRLLPERTMDRVSVVG